MSWKFMIQKGFAAAKARKPFYHADGYTLAIKSSNITEWARIIRQANYIIGGEMIILAQHD